MEFMAASTPQRIGSSIGALALLLALASYSGTGSGQAAPAGGPLAISSPAFANGAPIPVQYTCKGADVAPPLTWSAPLGAALVVDDPDAVNGVYVHWIVAGIPFGSGSTGAGQSPAGGTALPNTSGQPAYKGPCPPTGTGTHHYRFTLYQLPNDYQLPGGLAGVQAAQTIAGAATAQAQLIGTFAG
jgi:Raf kinase inhibitor-like YbhB/YbcL family protein